MKKLSELTTAERNEMLTKEFIKLKKTMGAGHAIDELSFKYEGVFSLQFDTIRNIVYAKNKKMENSPAYGTEQYKNQVDEIIRVFSESKIRIDELPKAMMIFIMDMSYSRAAICEAEKNYKKLLLG